MSKIDLSLTIINGPQIADTDKYLRLGLVILFHSQCEIEGHRSNGSGMRALTDG